MAGLLRLVRPMLAALRHQLAADPDRYGWEFKWDGVRAIAYVTGGEVRLVSCNDKDMTASYPELAVLAGRTGVPVILDGEIVAFRAGRPDFEVLQSRIHVRNPPGRLADSVPVQLYVFDLLHCGKKSLLSLPYTERRARLDDLGLDADPQYLCTKWNTHSRHLDLVGNRRRAFSIVLVGNQIADSARPAFAQIAGARARRCLVCRTVRRDSLRRVRSRMRSAAGRYGYRGRA